MIAGSVVRGRGVAVLMASTMLASLGWASTADAATAAETSPAPGADAPAVPDAAPQENDIVVTAQKRSESIQKVPISLQALDTATLDQHQVQSFDDYAKLLPSVSFQSFGPGQSQLFFRGIASGGDGLPLGSLPTAGTYLDEIPVTTIGALLDVHVYDIARVEALSGPQGTLYGASSLSGTLRIITNKPDPSRFSAGYDLQGNKFGDGGAGGVAEGFVNLPISQAAALRLVGFYERDGGFISSTFGERTYQRLHTLDDGSVADSPITVNNAPYVKHDYNSVDTYGGRAALGIELDDNWTVTPALIAQYQKSRGSFLYDPRIGDLALHAFTPEYNIDKWYQAALTIEGKVGNWDLVYSGGYLGRSIDNASDYSYYSVAYDVYPDYNYFQNSNGTAIDPTQRFHGHQSLTKQTHELRVSSPASNPWRITAGLFFQRQTDQNRGDYIIPGLGNAINTTPVYGDDLFLTNTHIVDRDYAIFGQFSYDLTSNLTFTGGIRGFKYNNTVRGFSGFTSDALNAGCSIPLATVDGCISVDKQAKGSGETHKLNLTWQIDRDHMVYATYSTGFRPGGTNRRAGIDPYDADSLDNYEFGWKTSWFNHALRWNGAAYYETWNKLQYALLVGTVTNIYNAGNARVYGLESDIQWSVGGHLVLSASGAYNDAKLTTDFCAIGASGNPDCSTGIIAAPKGTRLPIQPRIKGTATARYNFAIGPNAAFLQGTVLHQSSTRPYLGVFEAGLLGDTPPFTTADFSLGAKFGSVSVELFLQNAFDERGQLSRNTFCGPAVCGAYARIYPIKPRLFGVKLGQRF